MISSLIHKIKRTATPRGAVLMYHRIGYADSDVWQLTVNPDIFEQQLRILKSKYKVISLDALVQQQQRSKIQRGSIAITFDDGYLDNYTIAQPLLIKHNLPATFFIPTQSVESHREFWWDELEHIILHTHQLPQTFTAFPTAHSQVFDLENEAFLTAETRQRHQVWHGAQPPTTRRAALYLVVWKMLKEMPAPDREEALIGVRLWAGLHQPAARSEYTTGSSTHMLQAADSGLITIGGHTVTHPALSGLLLEEQQAEIHMGRKALEQALGRPIRHFAYPYGDKSPATQSIVRDLGFQSALTTHPSTITASSDVFALGRFQVNNWSENEFTTIVNNWMQYK